MPAYGWNFNIMGARLTYWAALSFTIGYQVVPVFVVYWPVVGWRLR